LLSLVLAVENTALFLGAQAKE